MTQPGGKIAAHYTFGNGFLLLEGTEVELRLVRDRGQVFVDIRNVGREWVDAETLLERCNLHPRPGERLTANDILTAIGAYSLELRSECSR